MPFFMQAALAVLLVAAAIHFILYTAKTERLRVIDVDQDFTVRYPRVYLWLCIVFFLLVSTLLFNMLIWHDFSLLKSILACVLAATGIPFLLLAVVWKIRLRAEYIIYTGMFGVRRQIYYNDIKRLAVTKHMLRMETTLRNYQFTCHIVYREYFLKRLHMNGVEINRYP